VRQICRQPIRPQPPLPDRQQHRARSLDRTVSVMDVPRPDPPRRNPGRSARSSDKVFLKLKMSGEEVGECPLLERLPVELRLRIWDMVVGEQVLHIVCEPGRLGAYVCDEQCRSYMRCDRWAFHDLVMPYSGPEKKEEAWRAKKDPSTPKRAASLLSLPLTCRLM
jgi:hypothetical protein